MTDVTATTCAQCGQRIFWATTRNGTALCLDARVTADGSIGVTRERDGLRAWLPHDQKRWPPDAHRHESHLKTCRDKAP